MNQPITRLMVVDNASSPPTKSRGFLCPEKSFSPQFLVGRAANWADIQRFTLSFNDMAISSGDQTADPMIAGNDFEHNRLFYTPPRLPLKTLPMRRGARKLGQGTSFIPQFAELASCITPPSLWLPPSLATNRRTRSLREIARNSLQIATSIS